MIVFPDDPAPGDQHTAGGATWEFDGTKWLASSAPVMFAQGEVFGNPDVTEGTGLPAGTATMLRADLGDGVAGQVLTSAGAGLDAAWAGLPGLPVLAQGEVLGTPGATPAAAVAADLALMLRAALGDGASGQVITSGGTGVDPAWAGLPAAPGLPTLAHAEVLGNPGSTPAAAIAAGIALMLRAAFGDGVAGQALISGGAGIDPAWGIGEYIVGAFIPSAPTANQVLLHHPMGRAVTIPANFAAHAGYASRARVRVAAAASYTILVQRATAAAPSTFSNVGTIVFAAGAFVGTFSTSGVDVAFAAGDTLALVAPATVDASLAGFSSTLVAREA
jgi:hypothetical protein